MGESVPRMDFEHDGPQIRVLRRDELSIEMIITNTDVSYVNGLRRAIINDVPTMAIDLVNIWENSSFLTDEQIAHRLGLIPMYSAKDVADMAYPTECECASGGCERCSVACSLAQHNDTTGFMRITDRHLQYDDTDESSPAQNVRPLSQVSAAAFDPVPLVKLAPGQGVRLDCVIRRGCGKLHAKFSPVSCCAFRPVPVITLSQEALRADAPPAVARALRDCCPQRLFETLPESGALALAPDAAARCIYCGECEKIRAGGTETGPRYVRVVPSADQFFMRVESTGQLPPERVVRMALQHLSDRVLLVMRRCQQLK